MKNLRKNILLASEVVNNKSIRSELQCINISSDKIEATDSFIAIRIAREDSQSQIEGLYPSKELKAEIKYLGEKHSENFMTPKQEGNYPSFDPIITSEEPIGKMLISPEFLIKILKCFKDDRQVTLEFRGSDKALRITTDKKIGLIMPLRF